VISSIIHAKDIALPKEKYNMRRSSFFAIFTIVAFFCVSMTASAQTDIADKFLISAKAGGVNHVEGTVSVVRSNATGGLLLKRDRVEVGDRVTTGSDGRAEILLNPGSYIRLASNSSFEFGATDLEDLQIKLDSGSAIFEVFAADEFRVSITTPKGKVALVDTGVYRVDVSSDGTALLSVTKGKAEIGDAAVAVKEGRTGTIGTGPVAVAKFDKGKRDNFAQWSKDRSKELTKVSSSIQDRNLNTAIARGMRAGRFSLYNSFGLWIFDASFGGYCFMPFGNGWRSPYGSWYYNGIYWPYWGSGYWPYGTPTGGSGAPATRKHSEVVRVPVQPTVKGVNDRIMTPPFTRVERGGDSGFGKRGMVNPTTDFDMSNSGNSGRSGVTFTAPPSYSPPVSSAPPPSKGAEMIRP
jgi:hypothetical protein